MRKIIKYFSIVLFAFCFTLVVIGDWNGTFYVNALEGDLECDYPSYQGSVYCYTTGSGGDSDSKTWTGYGTYTFSLGASHTGSAFGVIDLDDCLDPPESFCNGSNDVSWGVPPNPAVIRIEVTPEVE